MKTAGTINASVSWPAAEAAVCSYRFGGPTAGRRVATGEAASARAASRRPRAELRREAVRKDPMHRSGRGTPVRKSFDFLVGTRFSRIRAARRGAGRPDPASPFPGFPAGMAGRLLSAKGLNLPLLCREFGGEGCGAALRWISDGKTRVGRVSSVRRGIHLEPASGDLRRGSPASRRCA